MLACSTCWWWLAASFHRRWVGCVQHGAQPVVIHPMLFVACSTLCRHAGHAGMQHVLVIVGGIIPPQVGGAVSQLTLVVSMN
jgi:hypothetical protein